MAEKSFGDRTAPFLVILIVILAFVVGNSWSRINVLEKKTEVAQGGTGAVKGEVTQPTQAPAVEVKIDSSDPTRGKKDAKVKVVIFSDFQCPFCGAFTGLNKEMVSNMKSRTASWEPLFPGLQPYIDNGQVLFVYKDFSFLGQESNWAAEAARCAQEQDKFWEYHDYLYSNQKGENEGQFSRDNLKKFAATLGLDTNKFNTCLDTGKYTKEVQDKTAEGRAVGVNGTPALFINGKLAPGGAVPFLTVKPLIEEALKN